MTITSEKGRLMLSYMPRYYESSTIIAALLQAKGAEIDTIRAAPSDVLNQFFVQTATWGLNKWESELSLPVEPELTTEERRNRIISRLRGYGTVKVPSIKSIVETYDLDALVIEDFAACQVTKLFKLGIYPWEALPNITELRRSVRVIIPANTDMLQQRRYIPLTFGEIKTSQVTFGELKSSTKFGMLKGRVFYWPVKNEELKADAVTFRILKNRTFRQLSGSLT